MIKKPIGISFEFGCAEVEGKRKWFVYLSKQKLIHVRATYPINGNMINARYGGFKLDLNLGTLRGPIPKFWKKEFWSRDYMTQEPATNPWNSGKHWFVLTIPICIGIFISACFGLGEKQPGFYFGMKTYEVNRISQNLIDYSIGDPSKLATWTDKLAWGKEEEKGNIYLYFSMTLREDMVE